MPQTLRPAEALGRVFGFKGFPGFFPIYPSSVRTFLTMALSFRVTPTPLLISSALAGATMCFLGFLLLRSLSSRAHSLRHRASSKSSRASCVTECLLRFAEARSRCWSSMGISGISSSGIKPPLGSNPYGSGLWRGRNSHPGVVTLDRIAVDHHLSGKRRLIQLLPRRPDETSPDHPADPREADSVPHQGPGADPP